MTQPYREVPVIETKLPLRFNDGVEIAFWKAIILARISDKSPADLCINSADKVILAMRERNR